MHVTKSMDSAVQHTIDLLEAGLLPDVEVMTGSTIESLAIRRGSRIRYAIDSIAKQVNTLVKEHMLATTTLRLMKGRLPVAVFDVAESALLATDPDHARILAERTRELLGPRTLEAIAKALRYAPPRPNPRGTSCDTEIF